MKFKNLISFLFLIFFILSFQIISKEISFKASFQEKSSLSSSSSSHSSSSSSSSSSFEIIKNYLFHLLQNNNNNNFNDSLSSNHNLHHPSIPHNLNKNPKNNLNNDNNLNNNENKRESKEYLNKRLLQNNYENDSYYELIQSNLEKNVPPEEIDFENDLSPICYCVLNNNQKLLILLLKYNANVNDNRCKNEWTPLMFASLTNNIFLVQLLLENHANPLYISSDGLTPYHLTTNIQIQQILKNSIQLIEDNTNFISNSNKQVSQLLLVSYYQNKNTLKLLLDQNYYDINEQSTTLVTPLMLAAKSQNYENMKLLIEHSANVNYQDVNGMTALMYSIQSVSFIIFL